MIKPRIYGPIETPHGQIYFREDFPRLRKSQRSTKRRLRFERNRGVRKYFQRLAGLIRWLKFVE
jgi:hypothetical protein